MGANVVEIVFNGTSKVGGAAKNVLSNFANIGAKALKTGALVTGAFAAVGGTLFALTNSTAKVGDAFQKMAGRTGVSAQALSELAFAADLSGTNITTVETGLKILAKRMVDAGDGLKESKDLFDKLGISVKDTQGNFKSTEDTFAEVATGLQGLKTDTERAALAQELLGRGGVQLLPLIKSGAAGIQEMRDEARRLGITFSDVSANKSAAFIDSMSRLKGSFTGVKNVIGNSLTPIFTTMNEKIAKIITANKDLIAAKMPEVFKAVFSAAVDFVALLANMPVAFRAVTSAAASTGGAIIALGDALLSIAGAPTALGRKFQKFVFGVDDGATSIQKLQGKLEDIGTSLAEYADEQDNAGISSAEFADSLKKTTEVLLTSFAPTVEDAKGETESLGETTIIAGEQVKTATSEQVLAWNTLKETIQDFGLSQVEVLESTLQKNLEVALALNATEEEKAAIIIQKGLEIAAIKDQIRNEDLVKIQENEAAKKQAVLDREAAELAGAQSVSKALDLLLKKRAKDFKNVNVQMAKVAIRAGNQIVSGFSNGVATMIVDGGKFKDIMKGVFKQVAKSAIASIIQIGIQWLIARALGGGIIQSQASQEGGSIAARTFGNTFAAISAIPIVGPELAPAAAAGALSAVTTGMIAASGAGAAAGAASSIPKLAKGGIVSSPTIALIGEAGPEAVVPLKNSPLGGSVTIQKLELFPNVTAGEALLSISRDQLARWVERELVPVFQDLNRSGKFIDTQAV